MMRLRDAKKLHNRDDVIFKKTKEVGYVLGEPVFMPAKGKQKEWVNIPAQFPCLGFTWVAHDEVE
jgi:hypothetical protein